MFAKVSHAYRPKNTFSRGLMWDTPSSEACVPRSSAPQSSQSGSLWDTLAKRGGVPRVLWRESYLEPIQVRRRQRPSRGPRSCLSAQSLRSQYWNTIIPMPTSADHVVPRVLYMLRPHW